ncbi:MAG: tetratricopeptide repeat protein [Nitrospinales bacterium]
MVLSKGFKSFSLLLILMILPQCAEKSSDDYVIQAIEQTGRQEHTQAMESYLKAIDKDSRNPRAYYGLGGLYNSKEMYTQAEEVIKTALQIDPTYIDAYYTLGYTYEMMGRKEEAEENFENYRRLKKRLDEFTKEENESP